MNENNLETTTIEANETENNTNAKAQAPADGEFKVTVRKLEMPVRPRGVLAE